MKTESMDEGHLLTNKNSHHGKNKKHTFKISYNNADFGSQNTTTNNILRNSQSSIYCVAVVCIC